MPLLKCREIVILASLFCPTGESGKEQLHKQDCKMVAF